MIKSALTIRYRSGGEVILRTWLQGVPRGMCGPTEHDPRFLIVISYRYRHLRSQGKGSSMLIFEGQRRSYWFIGRCDAIS